MKLDATSEGRPLYQRYGFRDEETIERWALTRNADVSDAIPDRTRTEPRALDAALALDATIFGADRSQLLRSVIDESPEFALVESDAAGISGYAFGRRGTRADHLGPWMAPDERTAERLLAGYRSVLAGPPFVLPDMVGAG